MTSDSPLSDDLAVSRASRLDLGPHQEPETSETVKAKAQVSAGLSNLERLGTALFADGKQPPKQAVHTSSANFGERDTGLAATAATATAFITVEA